MKAVYNLVHEEDDSSENSTSDTNKKQNKKSPTDNSPVLLWAGLALLWTYGALTQVRPVLITDHALWVFARLGGGLQSGIIAQIVHNTANRWVQHPIAYNIISILMQLLIATLIWLGRKHLIGYIGVWLSLLTGLGVWIFGEGFGGLFHILSNVVSGVPGTGLLIAIASIMIILPKKIWTYRKTFQIIRIIFTLFWIVAAIWQTVFIVQLQQFSVPGIQYTQWWNVLAIVAFLMLAVIHWVTALNKVAIWISVLWLLICWWIGQRFGLLGGIALNIGTAPVIAYVILSLHELQRIYSNSTTHAESTSTHLD